MVLTMPALRPAASAVPFILIVGCLIVGCEFHAELGSSPSVPQSAPPPSQVAPTAPVPVAQAAPPPAAPATPTPTAQAAPTALPPGAPKSVPLHLHHPAAAPGPQDLSAPIAAGCSLTGGQLPPGAVGTTYRVACPAGCENTGGLWGTDVYTTDSAVCRAGIHAGAILPAGGVVTVQTQPGRPAYRGSARHGIQSWDFGSYSNSYAVVPPGGAAPAASAPNGPQVIEAGCSFSANDITDAIGTSHLVSCPPGCAGSGGLWGTDVYTADSAICRAAVHAGLLTDSGGTVTVIIDTGRPAYRGSTRNGIQSWDFGSYAKSCRLQKP
jgi:hypothetical protein